MHQGAFWHNLVYKLVNENNDASLVCSLTCDSRDLKVWHVARFPASIERVAERDTLFIFVLVFGTASGIGCYTSLLELESCNCLHKLSTNQNIQYSQTTLHFYLSKVWKAGDSLVLPKNLQCIRLICKRA